MSLLDPFRRKKTADARTCPACGRIFEPGVRFCPRDGTSLDDKGSHYDAFVSYRRESGSHAARVIRMMIEKLSDRKLFLDVDELGQGRFDERLLSILEGTTSLVLVLSPGALERCANEGDWLAREISHAFKLGKKIIPVMVDGFVFPDARILESMPRAIAELPNYQAVPYEHHYAEAGARRILAYMAEASLRKATSEPTPTPPPPSSPDRQPALLLPRPQAPNRSTHGRTENAHRAPIDSVALTPDGATLITCDREGKAKFWSMITRTVEGRLDMGRRGQTEIVVSPNSRLVVFVQPPEHHYGEHGGSSTLLVCSLQSKSVECSVVAKMALSRRFIAAITGDGQYLLTSAEEVDVLDTLGNWKNLRCYVDIWSIPGGQHLTTVPLGDGGRGGLDGHMYFAAESQGTVLCCCNNFIKRIRVPDGALLKQAVASGHDSGGMEHLALSPDRRYVVSTSEHGSTEVTKIWSLEELEELKSFEMQWHSKCGDAEFTRDGSYLLTKANGLRVRSMDANRMGDELTVLPQLGPHAISPDGNLVVTPSSVDNRETWFTGVWSIPDFRLLAKLKRDHGENRGGRFVITPDSSRLIAAYSDGSLIIWNLNRRVLEYEFLDGGI